jgi:hypothetical protein
VCTALLIVIVFLFWRSSADERGGLYGAPVLRGHIEYAQLDESSGLAVSGRGGDVLWSINSDPDDPFLYCLASNGASCGVWRVPAVESGDWEAVALGPGPIEGEPYVYIGDIGDNEASRTELIVYRLREPSVRERDRASSEDDPIASEPPEDIRLGYPDRPRDAETLLIHPRTGHLYVVTKHPSQAVVYKGVIPGDLAGRVALEAIATIRSERITDGSISADGRRVILCTNERGYELTVPAGAGVGFDSIWMQKLVPVAMPPGVPREGCAYRPDGSGILTTSEGAGTPLYEIPLAETEEQGPIRRVLPTPRRREALGHVL